ncbi:hypothetical protein MNBD_GAMMA18-1208 [hydrothermal vent metagenome]|uniref:Uncharacterized protein n=1 Tax=hydrothermal vent metagenome TaxID=652676 RepID=A0A3B0ZJQ5_9ZZZZ
MVWADGRGCCLLALLLFVSPVMAESDGDEPTLELLEFLAEWQDNEGRWIDPVALVVNEENLVEDNESGEGNHD